jgi:hypothetical protein
VYPYTVTDDRVGKEKIKVKNFSDEIVLGKLVIMRLFCVIYVQRPSTLVTKNYAPRICLVWISSLTTSVFSV